MLSLVNLVILFLVDLVLKLFRLGGDRDHSPSTSRSRA